MSTTVRPLTQADEPAWRKLFLAYHEYYKLTPDDTVISTTFARFLDDSEPMFASLAVSESGEPVGLVHWLTHRSTLAVNDYIYLHDLFVADNTRSRGIGRKLIEHVYEDADQRKAARVYWQTKVRAALEPVCCLASKLIHGDCSGLPQHDNHRAQLLYVKAGFKNGFVCYQRPNKE